VASRGLSDQVRFRTASPQRPGLASLPLRCCASNGPSRNGHLSRRPRSTPCRPHGSSLFRIHRSLTRSSTWGSKRSWSILRRTRLGRQEHERARLVAGTRKVPAS